MSLQDFVDKSRERYREQGPGVLPAIGTDFVFSALSRVPVIPKFGTNVFEREWDVLLILDAARLDMYRRIVNPDADSIWSVGSSSNEWMQHTFTDRYADEMAETVYVTGNPFSDEECPAELFAGVDEMWRDHWDEEVGTIRPQPITDRVVARHREGASRVIGHYMQPHYPFIGKRTTDGGKMTWDIGEDESKREGGLGLWDQFLYGVRDDLDAVREAYENNLRHVWSHVQTVRENVDGQVAVTADHGNALGEWFMWGHIPGMQHPKMRRVPWDTYDCVDRGTHMGDEGQTDEARADVEDRLKQLGYK